MPVDGNIFEGGDTKVDVGYNYLASRSADNVETLTFQIFGLVHFFLASGVYIRTA